MTHSTLLILGAALLTAVFAALLFGSNGSAEDKRLREEQKLLRALEAQRRIRNAQLLRDKRRRVPVAAAPRPAQVEPEAEAEEVAPVTPMEPGRRAAARQRKREENVQAATAKAERIAEAKARRDAEQQHTREQREQEASAKAQREAEEQSRRRAEQERKAALKAEQAERRAADERRKRHEKEQAAAEKAQREADAEARRRAEERAYAEPARSAANSVGDIDKPLSELPLFSWAHRIENEDRAPREPD